MKKCISNALSMLMLAVFLPLAASAQYCPSYTASSPNNVGNCAIEAVVGVNPGNAQWNSVFDLVAGGSNSWGSQGPTVAPITRGCNAPTVPQSVPATVPREILMAMAYYASSWRQFCVPTAPADQVGGASRTIITFDCRYGVGQVSSGMTVGGNPDFDRLRVASEPVYNAATAAKLLASKWSAMPCVGDRQPDIIEDWYSALWASDGLAYANNPSNPAYASNRGVWDPAVGAAAPYQEKIFGLIEHPPGCLWTAIPLAYPNSASFGNASSPPVLSEPVCASPTNCVNSRPTHHSVSLSDLLFADSFEVHCN